MQTPIRALYYPISDDTGGKRLRVETDYESYVRQLIKQVLLTNPGERIHMPDFGAGVRALLFSPLSAVTASLAQTMVYNALNQTLADIVRVDEVVVTNIDSRLDITVIYTLYARMQQRRLNLQVTS
jgi:phage baseplate assembly protein W